MAKTKLARHNKLRNYGLALSSFIIAFILGTTLIAPVFDRRFDVFNIYSSPNEIQAIGDNPEDNTTPAYLFQGSGIAGSFIRKVPNFDYFYNILKKYSAWQLEGWNPQTSQWVSEWNGENLNSWLTVSKVRSDDNFNEKVSLTVKNNAPIATKFRFTFGIDLRVKEFVNRTGQYEYTLTYQANKTENYNMRFNWSDLIPLVQAGTISLNHGIKNVGGKNVFWFRITGNQNLAVGKSFVVDPTYGLIGDAVTNSYEYNKQNGQRPDMIKLGSDATFSYFAIVNNGIDTDGWINTTKVWNSNGTIYPGNVDSYEYDASDGFYPSIVHISGDVYAIAYWDMGSAKETVNTVSITSLGDIDTVTGVIDTQTLTYNSAGDIEKILRVNSDNIFAVAYSGAGSAFYGWIETINITDAGAISAVISTVKFETGYSGYIHAVMVDSDTILISYYGTADNKGNVQTRNISGAGVIGASAADQWEYTSNTYVRGDVLKLNDQRFLLAARGPPTTALNFAHVYSLNITNDGMVTKSFSDYCNLSTSATASTNYEELFVVNSGSVYGMTFQGASADGYVVTFNCTSTGFMNDTKYCDYLEFDTSNSIAWAPITYIANDYYYIVYEGTGNDGWSKTVTINTNWASPTFSNPSPANSSTGQVLTPQCAITINDINGDAMTLNWYENSTGSYLLRQTNSSCANGTYRWTDTYASANNHKYWWKVYANDGTHNVSTWYCFTTEAGVVEQWNTIATWNGSVFNQSAWKQIQLWNGSIYNQSIFNQIANWNGSLFNQSSWNQISLWNGSIYNETNWIQTSLWNGSLWNNSGWEQITDWNGSIYNQSNWNQITLWNGSIYNTSNFLSIQDWNGSIYNETNWIQINLFNGTIYNESAWSQVNLWNGTLFNTSQCNLIDEYNGTIYNQTGTNLINDWNGSIQNSSIWNQISLWNGSIFNTSSYHIIQDINGTVFNASSYSQISIWNGTIYNITSFIQIQEWNGTVYNTSSFKQIALWNGSIFNTSIYTQVTLWNGSIYNTSAFEMMNDWNGSIWNTSNWIQTNLWNGSLFNISAYIQISLWNGTIYNQTAFIQIQNWNGSIHNISNWLIVSEFNGTLWNQSIWIKSMEWNGSIYNISGYSQINLWNGSIYNQSLLTIVNQWNGSIFNQSQYHAISTWNGSLYNASSIHTINNWNGTIFNSSLFNLVNQWNGSIYNQSSYNQVEQWNGTIYNISIGFVLVQNWNGSIYNQSSWSQVSLWNGTVFNTSAYTQVNLWNGSLFNISSFNVVNLWNGSIWNGTNANVVNLWNGSIFNQSVFKLIQNLNGSIYNSSGFIQVALWNGSIFNSSISTQVSLLNGSIFNVSGFSLIQDINGSIFNTTGAILIQDWNGSIYNLTSVNIIYEWNGTIWNSSSFIQINLWNGSVYNTSSYHQIQDWNGTIYNQTIKIWNSIADWNGSIYNTSGFKLINDWNGTVYNQSQAHAINLWNGTIFNITGMIQIQDWNGSIFNQSIWTQLSLWNGTIFNTSFYVQINLWNGSIYNLTSAYIINNWNGTIFNLTIQVWNLIADWNGSIYNTTGYLLIQNWNGTIYNQTISNITLSNPIPSNTIVRLRINTTYVSGHTADIMISIDRNHTHGLLMNTSIWFNNTYLFTNNSWGNGTISFYLFDYWIGILHSNNIYNWTVNCSTNVEYVNETYSFTPRIVKTGFMFLKERDLILSIAIGAILSVVLGLVWRRRRKKQND